jgi:cytochrome oxidase Cu insertion factor (SCO1/SenC/PrrC family)
MLLLLLALSCAPREPVQPWRESIASWQPSQPVPDVPLVDQHGESFDLARTRGKWLVIGFIYTRCPKAEACPMTMQRLVALDRAAQERGLELGVLALTLDPAYDTPPRLRAFATRHGADPRRVVLATGEPELVAEALPSLFNVIALPGEGGTLDHTVRVVLLDPEGHVAGRWSDEAITVDAVLARTAPPRACDAGRLVDETGEDPTFAGATVTLCERGAATWGFVTGQPGYGGPVGAEENTLYPGEPLRWRPGRHEDGEVVRGRARWSPGQLEGELSLGLWSLEGPPSATTGP